MNNYPAHLKRAYGLSQEDYDSQAAAQNFLCAVCREANPHGKPLGVDHNHVTGANRELLCDRCNKILGFARDSQELMFMLICYLRKHDGPASPYVPNNAETQAARDAAFEQSLSPSEQPQTQGLSDVYNWNWDRGPIQVLPETVGVGPQGVS